MPEPTHKTEDNYKTVNQKRFEGYSINPHFRWPKQSDKAVHNWVTVKEAFSDLPVLFPTSNSKYRMVKLNEEQDYSKKPQNDFQYKMRHWYETESTGSTGNAFRNNSRDFKIFERMKQGDDYLDASRIADELFEEEVKVFGFKKGSPEYTKLHKKIVPVYDRGKFEHKWLKLDENRPSHTLMAHLSKDTYSHIHPYEPRGISVREAARIQSFPDDFFFDCSMGDAYKQIGNAVPPLLALAVAEKIVDAFN